MAKSSESLLNISHLCLTHNMLASVCTACVRSSGYFSDHIFVELLFSSPIVVQNPISLNLAIYLKYKTTLSLSVFVTYRI